MGLIAVPNVSEGRDLQRIEALGEAVRRAGAHLADVHTDAVHNRSVFTVGGDPTSLVAAMTALASRASEIDLTRHEGIHPRLGGLDVCPIVPHGSELSEAVPVALTVAERIASECGLPVYLYGAAARRAATRSLPDIRRGGLEALMTRAKDELPPDFGPRAIDERIGVVCVGARPVLIAFNVWIQAPVDIARSIADRVRSARSGMAGVRALGLRIDEQTSQVSMNLTEPDAAGVDSAFAAIRAIAEREGVRVVATELVGVPPQRYMPDPQREAARLLRGPGRSLESVLT